MSHNDFSSTDRVLFIHNWKCWWCSKNRADSLHHIVGRGSGDSEVERSILNAAPLCNHSCHLPFHGKLRTDPNVRILLNKTWEFILESGKVLQENDLNFLKKYASHY